MINLNELRFDYGANATVFQGLTLNIPEGRSVGVLGANGVGKTTLIKLISGMLTPTSGQVKVLSTDPRQRDVALYQQLFVLPEESELPAISGRRYVRLFSVFYPSFDVNRCNDLLAKFDVDVNKKLTTMSLGQKKKFLVAFALSTGCKLILMDEPTNGLDIPSKAAFRDIVIQHQQDDQTLLICTHQVRDLDSIIDSVVMMNEEHAHWFDLGALPEKVAQFHGPEPEGALFSEPRMGSRLSLVPVTDQSPTDIDLELLFNTFHNNYPGLMNVVSMEAAQ